MNYVRYSVLNSILALIAASSCYFYNALGLLVVFDPTKISLLILAIVVAIIIYLGIRGSSANLWLVKWTARLLPALGLVGTVVGAMMMLHAFGTQEAISSTEMSKQLMTNMAPAFLTTSAGIGGVLILFVELVFCYGRKGDDEYAE